MDLEGAVSIWARRVTPVVGLSVVGLPFGPVATMWPVLAHLTLLVGFGVLLAAELAPLADAHPFGAADAGSRSGWIGAAAVVVVLATGGTALVTLASSSALRYQPSLQFLQLLSALDIVWAGAALYLGLRWSRGRRWAWAGAAALGVFCVWSLWNYLSFVGLGPDGGWLVDGAEMMRRIIPYDMAAAVAALVALWVGAGNKARRSAVAH